MLFVQTLSAYVWSHRAPLAAVTTATGTRGGPGTYAGLRPLSTHWTTVAFSVMALTPVPSSTQR